MGGGDWGSNKRVGETGGGGGGRDGGGESGEEDEGEKEREERNGNRGGSISLGEGGGESVWVVKAALMIIENQYLIKS